MVHSAKMTDQLTIDYIKKKIENLKIDIFDDEARIDELDRAIQEKACLLRSLESELKFEEYSFYTAQILNNDKLKNDALSDDDKHLIVKAINISKLRQYKIYDGNKELYYPEYPILYSQLNKIIKNITNTKENGGVLTWIEFKGIKYGTGPDFGVANEYEFKYEFEYTSKDGYKSINVCIM